MTSPSRPYDSEHYSRRGYWSLIVTQFLGAFTENALKTLVIFMIAGMSLAPAERDRFVLLVGAAFSLPFIFFSMLGGNLADRFSKRTVTIVTRALSVLVMVLAAFALRTHNITLLLWAVFLISTPGALFGPSKYGLLPELLPEKRLSWGNGILELGTFVAIIFGTGAGAVMEQHFKSQPGWSGTILTTLTVTGLLASFGITRVPAADPGKPIRVNFLSDLATEVRSARKDPPLFMSILGYTFFFFVGALLQLNIVFFGQDVLHLNESSSAMLLAVLGVGIGLGSLTAGFASRRKIEYGLIPLGSIGMTVFGFLLFAPQLTSFYWIAALLAGLGFFGGFFIVPVNAALQHRPAPERKGGVLATANLLSFVGIFAATGAYYALTSHAHLNGLPLPHLGAKGVFVFSGVLSLIATVYIVVLLPVWMLRLILWALTNTVYRIQVVGRDNIPEKGGALFVCNHLSFVDALLLVASTDRFIRFIMFKDIYDQPYIKPLAKLGRAIPISSAYRPRDMIKALREASDAISAGQVVCIFAEGQITRIGQLLPFRRGMERIMKGVSPETNATIVPVHLDGVWGSLFSYERKRFIFKLPRHLLRYPVTVSFGPALPPTATPFEVRQAVQKLHTAAYASRKRFMKPIHRRFLSTARRHPFRFAMADFRVEKMSFAKALIGSIALARRLRDSWKGQEMVGILLPPGVGAALVNMAALFSGKIPVNLNYTASKDSIASAAEQCQIKTVITSQAFLEKYPVEVPGQKILLEDFGPLRATEKLAALPIAFFFPARLVELSLGMKKRVALDDLATVIFSSGSTGEPKGVMLTHYNVGSNIEQMAQVFSLSRHDRLIGVLPLFHSFGFSVTLCLPLTLGIGSVYHPNPLDAKVIGGLVAKYGCTFLIATPTFLQAYVRRCEPEEFGSLQYVLAGAEKLPDRLAQAFEDHFGIRPLEGYGCTEAAPVVAVNTRDYRAPGFRQVGAKRGKIGHPLPGISARIVSPDTGEEIAVGQPGLLLISGPNVMKGYLGKPEKTAEVLREGWYNTGDIATLDEDGFLQIGDRLSRFSKIGGEMVPHIKVEEKLHDLGGYTEQKFAVAGVPDEKKGERLVVLHILDDAKLKEVTEKLSTSDLPPLWRPRANQFYRVEAIPYLGTGKLDLKKIKDLAAALSKEEVTA